MARGKRLTNRIANTAPLGASAGVAKNFRAKNIALSEMLTGSNGGEVIKLAGGDLFCGDDISPLVARGLISVLQVRRRPDGLYYVRFHDGSRALVDLEGNKVAFSDGTSANDPRLYGAFGRALIFESDEGDPLAALLGRYLNDPSDPENLAALAKALGISLQELEVRLNNKELQSQIPRLEMVDIPEEVKPRRFPRGAAPSLTYAMARDVQAMVAEEAPKEMGPNEEQLKGLVYGWKDDGSEGPADVNPGYAQLGAEAALEIGEPVVELRDFVEDLYLNDGLIQAVGSLFNRYEAGQRTFGAMGYHGTGKDTLFKTVAGLLRLPMVTLNGGQGAQLQEWIGGEALVPHEVYNTCGHCDHCKNGKTDKCESRQLVAAFPVSAVQYGKLTRALQTPSLIHISEIRGMEDQFLTAHDWMGSGIGQDAKNRFLVINSPQGTETIHVDPNCVVCFSWNPDIDDWRPHPATMRRMGLFCFDPLSEEEESKRIGAMVNKMLGENSSYPEFHRKNCNCKGCLDRRGGKVAKANAKKDAFLSEEDVLPVARFFKKFQDTENVSAHEISTGPAPQTFAYFLYDVITKAAAHAAAEEGEDPGEMAVSWSMTMLEGFLNQSSMDRESRKRALYTILGEDNRKALADIVNRVTKIIQESESKEA